MTRLERLLSRLPLVSRVAFEAEQERSRAELAKARTEAAERIEALRASLARLESRIDEGDNRVLQSVYDTTKRTTVGSTPNPNPLTEMLRDIAVVRWNSKVLGAQIARNLYELGAAGHKAEAPDTPVRANLTSKLCRQADIESEWMRYWCRQLKIAPIYSRKIWEYGFVLQALWEAGLLEPGRRGLGFAVGNEITPAYFCSRGVETLATDLAGEDQRAHSWRNTDQHASTLDQLYRHEYLEKDSFQRLCKFRPVDMNRIPEDLHGQFDFCWSMCSFEHVGSLELGLQFVENSIKCLKAGGLAVHTTEYSFEPTDETIDVWPTVLFQARHIAELSERLKRDGHELLPFDQNPGDQVLDQFIDGPPYPHNVRPHLSLPEAPHLRLSVDGFFCTSIGLIVRKSPG